MSVLVAVSTMQLELSRESKVMFSGSTTIVCNFEQPRKAQSSMTLTDFGIMMDWILECSAMPVGIFSTQSPNVICSMFSFDMTVDPEPLYGVALIAFHVRDLRLLQLPQIERKYLTDFPTVRCSRYWQLLNAPYSIEITPSGIITDLILVPFRKKRGIISTLFPKLIISILAGHSLLQS